MEASRRLVQRLLDPAAEEAGKQAWVEITGPVIEFAPFLLDLFPRARFINMVREGRAVVAGTLRKVDLTDDPMLVLAKWEQMVSAEGAAMRSLPDGPRAHDRPRRSDGARSRSDLRSVVGFLEIADPAPMREYFEREISAERAHVGAWRQRMAPADARKVGRRYRRVLRKLRREGSMDDGAMRGPAAAPGALNGIRCPRNPGVRPVARLMRRARQGRRGRRERIPVDRDRSLGRTARSHPLADCIPRRGTRPCGCRGPRRLDQELAVSGAPG